MEGEKEKGTGVTRVQRPVGWRMPAVAWHDRMRTDVVGAQRVTLCPEGGEGRSDEVVDET